MKPASAIRISARRGLLASVSVLLLVTSQSSLAQQLYTSYTIGQVQAPQFDRDCLYFTLVGVTQADPVNPNNPWFGIPRTQTGFSENYAMLLAAKLNGTPIEVRTTGTAAGGACGPYAGVYWVTIP